MFVTNWISTTKIQKISEITNFFRHYFLSRTEVIIARRKNTKYMTLYIIIPYVLVIILNKVCLSKRLLRDIPYYILRRFLLV